LVVGHSQDATVVTDAGDSLSNYIRTVYKGSMVTTFTKQAWVWDGFYFRVEGIYIISVGTDRHKAVRWICSSSVSLFQRKHRKKNIMFPTSKQS